MVAYDDLAEQAVLELPSLKIADSTQFSQGLMSSVPSVRCLYLVAIVTAVYDLSNKRAVESKTKANEQWDTYHQPRSRTFSRPGQKQRDKVNDVDLLQSRGNKA